MVRVFRCLPRGRLDASGNSRWQWLAARLFVVEIAAASAL